jgi:hypothetical protein
VGFGVKHFSLLIGRKSRVREQSGITPKYDRFVVEQTTGPRVPNATVHQLFKNACESGDLDAAADVLALLESWQSRRTYATADQRQADLGYLLRMRTELEHRRHLKATQANAA